jgi:hypothetical protein
MPKGASSSSLPLHLCQVLEAEYEHLHGPLPDEAPDWLLDRGQLRDAGKLVAKLHFAGDQLCSYLKSRFSPALQAALDAANDPEGAADGVLPLLIEELNRLLPQPDFYSAGHFSQVRLSEQTRTLLSRRLEGDDRVRVHRLVLEEAFPAHVASSSDTRIFRVIANIHRLRQGPGAEARTALCFSGGGIRSATFALGVLQGLARAGVLDKFDYISTVSGGGYIGSWLTAWISRAGLPAVASALQTPSGDDLDPEPAQVRYLRTFSNYLSPRLGFFSADTWTLVATFLRNIVLHWSMLIPLLALVLLVPRACLLPVTVYPLPWITWLALALSFVMGAAGIAYVEMDLPSVGNRRWSQGHFLKYCMLPLSGAAVLLTVFWAWHRNAGLDFPPLWAFALFGLLLHTCGWAAGRFAIGSGPEKWDWLLVPLVGALGGGALQSVAENVFPDPYGSVEHYVCFAAPLILVLFLAATTLYIGLSSNFTSEDDREWWSRSGAWFLIGIIGWVAGSSVVLLVPVAALSVSAKLKATIAASGGLAGLLSAIGGHFAKSGAGEGAGLSISPGMKARIVRAAPMLLALLFIVTLLVALSMGTGAILESRTGPWAGDPLKVFNVRLQTVFGIAVAVLALVALFGRLLKINRFSLNSMYGNRIVRAYLGASNTGRRPHPFTGFDPADNIQMTQLRPVRPFHVVNMALNLVKGKKLAWQQRKAESFVATPLHSGSWSSKLGFRDSAIYGGKRGISLGKAVAISGAAASPNMGYHSSPLITFLMTLFNARLGWWLGNPGIVGDRTFDRSGPAFAIGPLVQEAFGLTDDENPYVYLSDGGHFENLGLYEMVLRRCHIIVLSDAGCDPDYTFEDLGNAIRKIRVDMGIPIEFDSMGIRSWRDRSTGPRKCCAVGRIRYSAIDGPGTDGVLVYIKPVVCGDEPPDILNYAAANGSFPHEPTSDQWFSESQFESYRMLGAESVRRAALQRSATLREFVRGICTDHLLQSCPKWLLDALQ